MSNSHKQKRCIHFLVELISLNIIKSNPTFVCVPVSQAAHDSLEII